MEEVKVQSKEVSVEELKRRANRSLNPFILLVAFGGVALIATIISTLVISFFFTLNVSSTGSSDLSEIGVYLGLFAIPITFGLASDGLLGAGIPLLIINAIRKKNAIRKLAELNK